MNAASAKGISGAKLLIALALIATVCVPLFLGATETCSALLQFPLAGYVEIIALVVLNWLARSLKLQILLRRLRVHAPFARVLGVSFTADFGFMVTPAGIGGYAASVYFLCHIGASTSSAAAIIRRRRGRDRIECKLFRMNSRLIDGRGAAHLAHGDALSRPDRRRRRDRLAVQCTGTSCCDGFRGGLIHPDCAARNFCLLQRFEIGQ